jgi:hypothetical protein
LRRLGPDKPLPDAIMSGRTPDREEAISDHPCLKPQHFMRIIVRSLLPLGEGVVLDPFMGSGSTIAASEATGYESIGIELDEAYYRQAERCIPRLAASYPDFTGETLLMNGSLPTLEPDDSQQMVLCWPSNRRSTSQNHGATYPRLISRRGLFAAISCRALAQKFQRP